jgi:hypothetical protein
MNNPPDNLLIYRVLRRLPNIFKLITNIWLDETRSTYQLLALVKTDYF